MPSRGRISNAFVKIVGKSGLEYKNSCLFCAGFRVAAEGGGSGGQSFGVCFLASGLYSLHVYDVGVVQEAGTPAAAPGGQQTGAAPGISMHALHVLVQ